MQTKIPQELIDHRQWVVWKSISRDGKATKVPFQPSGVPASSTNHETWSEFYECVRVSKSYAGIGFVFDKEDPYIGIDLDGCRSLETGLVDEWAKEIITKFGTYAEVSPSGTGVKLWGKTDFDYVGINKKEMAGEGHGGKKPAIEIYSHGRYFACTGKRLQGLGGVVNVDAQLDWLKRQYGLAKSESTFNASSISIDTPLLERASKYIAKMDPAISGSNGHGAAFKVACVLCKGFGLDESEAFNLFMKEYNTRCNPEWSEREVRHKISSALRQPGSTGYLADAQPADWDRIAIPSQYKCDKMPAEKVQKEPPKLRTSTLRQASSQYLEVLKGGIPHLLKTGIPDLDFSMGGGVGAGEFVIIAARPGHGKSAIALQMVHHITSNGIPVGLISEEMSAMALGKRTIQFVTDVREDDWVGMEEHIEQELISHFSGRADAHIVESCGTVLRAVEEAERMQKDHGIKALFVDYAQILQGIGRSRYEQITEVSQTLRQLASRTGLTVFVLAQLSRDIEKRDKFIPTMRDLKETGQLEQDADVIIFGVYPHKLDPGQPKNSYTFFIGKNRSREIKRPVIDVLFDTSRQTFNHAVELEPESEYAKDFR